MNKNILAAFGVGALLAVGGTYLVMSNKSAAPVEITSKTTEQALPVTTPEPVAEPTPAPPPEPVRKPSPVERAPRPASPRTVAKSTPPPTKADPAPAYNNTPPPQLELPKQTAHVEPAPPAAPAPAPVEIRKPDPIAEEARRKQREPNKVTIPGGTQIVVRLQETLSADKMAAGDTFHATLDAPLEVGGFVLAERGARAVGRVVESDKAGRVKGVSKLAIELTQFTSSDGQTIMIQSEPFNREGNTSKKSDAAKIGAGAAVGAALGAIFGGGKGAAIGAGAGGGAGAGTVLMTRGKPAVIEVESRIPFQTKGDVTVTEKIR